MLVVHHPRLYRPLATLDVTDPVAALATEAVRAGLAVYCAHTNLDVAPGGVNDALADLIDLRERRPLAVTARDPYRKLIAFVPETHHEPVREALWDAGAGEIGDYADCSFATPGIGTFRGGEETNPFLGEPGRLEEAEEVRLEVILPESLRGGVEAALRAAHPYEEPAYEFHPLLGAAEHGLGRTGCLPRALRLSTLAQRLKKATGSGEARLLGDPKRTVRRVAVWSGGGCGAAELAALRSAKTEALVTGELRYHDAELLEQAGLAALVLGHGPSEAVVLPRLASAFAEAMPEVKVVVHETTPGRMRSI
jgi:putative NIF3 family GTP cyclohydrolase 1 type 2